MGFKTRTPALRFPGHRRKLLLLTVFSIFVYFLFHHLPAPPTTQNDTRADRPPPQYDVETTPRFLHDSPFRKTPDLDYEATLSRALKEIEQRTLLANGGNDIAQQRIWQIGPGVTDRGSDSIDFEQQNSEWEYSIATDDWAKTFVTETLSTVPDLAKLYYSYPHNVLRADLLRYLLLWYYGGFYADMDVFPARSINSCPALQPLFSSDTNPNISLVLGIEIDEPHASPRLMKDWHWSRSYGFIQYTMYAPRRFSPLLREAIVRVLAHTKQHERSGTFFSPQYDETTILEVTGPGVFTDAILDVLSQTLPPAHTLIKSSMDSDAGIGDLISPSTGVTWRRVTWAPFHRIREPLCVDASEAATGNSMGGLCVLPVSVWGNGQRHSGAEGFNSRHACVNHRFGRTWKKGWWEFLFG